MPKKRQVQRTCRAGEEYVPLIIYNHPQYCFLLGAEADIAPPTYLLCRRAVGKRLIRCGDFLTPKMNVRCRRPWGKEGIQGRALNLDRTLRLGTCEVVVCLPLDCSGLCSWHYGMCRASRVSPDCLWTPNSPLFGFGRKITLKCSARVDPQSAVFTVPADA